MRPLLALMAAALTMIASACSTLPEPEKPTVRVEFERPALPPIARLPCDEPVILPDRRISQGEATPLWLRDRAALVECEARRAAGVAAVDQIPQRAPEE